MKKQFSRRSHKKASLEISVQAIVIVVLAMTLLGLGLGFVRNLFTSISSTTEDVQAQVKQRILDDLITNDKKLSFPKTEIRIDKGASEVLTVGLRNKKDTPLSYYLSFKFIATPAGTGATATILNDPAALIQWFQFDGSPTQIPSADSAVRSVRLTVPTSVTVAGTTYSITQGSYALTFKIKEVTCLADASEGIPNGAVAPLGTSGCNLDNTDVADAVYDQKDLFVVVKG